MEKSSSVPLRRWGNLLTLVWGVLAFRATSGQAGQRPTTAASGAAGLSAAAPAPAVVFEGVTVVDVAQGKLVPNQRVVIADHHIQNVGTVGTVQMPIGAQVVKARGRYLIPGLWDMHVHPGPYADLFYPLFIANGVTGIRDASSSVGLDTLRQWRQEILAGRRVGPPRQLLSGQAIDYLEARDCRRMWARRDSAASIAADIQSGSVREEILIPLLFHACVSDTASAQWLVDSLKAAGADMIKMYGLPREMYFVIAAEARRQGIPFGGHLDGASAPQSGMPTLREASDSGASIFDHREPLRAAVAPCLEPRADRTPCRMLAARLRRNGTWFVPTWSHLGPEGIYMRVSHMTIYTRLRHHLRPYLSTFWLPLLPSKDIADLIQMNAEDSVILRRAQEGGFPLLAGTDVAFGQSWAPPGGFALQVELTALVAEGLTPLTALQSATVNPVQMLHASDSLGTVATGKLADLVLLDGNPLADITNTAAIRAVVANGRYYDRAVLDQILAQTGAAYQRYTEGVHPLWFPRP